MDFFDYMDTNIVTVGGGTGSYTILSGLKKLKHISLKALVAMADNGGSTGVLRDELGVLPPGDVRQCLVALSEHSDIVRKLINYRFEEGKLAGHSFGNILLAALEKVTGDFTEGVAVASEILKVNGVVIPITKDQAKLSALCKNGNVVLGQVNVEDTDFQSMGLESVSYAGDVNLNKNAKKAILEADYIILGPGNYYSSIIPNLIVNGFKKAINESKAKIIFPINLTNKHGHTQKWKVSNYVKDVEKYLGKKVDYILVNNEAPSKEQVERYKLEEGSGVLVEDDLKDKRVIRGPLFSKTITIPHKSDERQTHRAFIRHDEDAFARVVEEIIQKNNEIHI